MLKIALCDDDNTELTITHDMISEWMSDIEITGQIVSFNTASELIGSIEDGNRYDMFILDVIMPECNGIELGHKLRSISGNDDHTPIIYITSSSGYAVDSYDVRAFYYLVKPVAKEKLNSVLVSAFQMLITYDNNVFPVRTKSGTISVSYSSICFVELSRRSLHFVCRENEISSVTIQGSFKEAVARLLENEQFYACGASIVVNLSLIRSIDKNELIFINGKTITIPRAIQKQLYAAWIDYCLDGGI